MHTIHNIAFEVDVNYTNSLVSWEQYYVDFFQERLLPRVERMCDDWDKKHPNTKCVIDTIDIDVEVGNLDLESLQKEIIQQISQQLNSIQSDGSTSDSKIVATITKEASPFEGLVAYVSNGILPANISVKVFKEWLGAVAEFTSVEKNQLVTLFSTKTVAIERMLSLLQNDYAKLSTIIAEKQQITAQFVKLEKSFFEQFLKEICAQYKLTFRKEEAEIWFQTLGLSSSLPQFSKTLVQLLTPKAQAENKRFTQVAESQLTVSVLQAITQYEIGDQISIDVSKIVSIQKATPSASQKSDATATKKSTQKSTHKSDQKFDIQNEKAQSSESQAKSVTASQKEKEAQQTANKASKKSQTTEQATATTSNVRSEEAANTNNTTESTTKDIAESNLAKAQKKQVATPFLTRETIGKDIDLTTEKAGLILLHPFLSRFFKGVGLVNENKEIEDIGKACMLLHFLATETETVTDVELTLEKVLLGIPLETVINYQTPLTETDKGLCKELLEAVLENWGVLRKSTINTLRDMFLKRDGELTITEKSIKLKVERAAQDILLEKVPWNISLIRLRWMDTLMHVEW